ncbi:hypothetical protein WDW89_22390 [Deltaproteobacteria bacterium TL4]
MLQKILLRIYRVETNELAMRSQADAEGQGSEKISGIIPITVDAVLSLKDTCISPKEWDQINLYYIPAGSNFIVLGKQDHSIPAQFFVVSDSLLKRIKKAETLGDPIEPHQLLKLCLQDTSNAVRAEFSAGAINDINRTYYATGPHLPDIVYVIDRTLNTAIAKYIGVHFKDHSTLRIKELCSNNNPKRWEYFAQTLKELQLQVELSDFTKAGLPDVTLLNQKFSNLHLSTSLYNLFHPMKPLKNPHKFEVMTVAYGFDSVWLPEDRRYVKKEGHWYEYKYRIKVLDSYPNKKEVLKSLRAGKVSSKLYVRELATTFIEEVVEAIDIESQPYGSFIAKRATDGNQYNTVEFCFPGGLIKRVNDAFENQLTAKGVFIIGEVATFTPVHPVSKKLYDPTRAVTMNTGPIGKYRKDDYIVAKEILEKQYHLKVDLFQLSEFVKNQLTLHKDEHNLNKFDNHFSQCLMIVYKGC